MSTNPDNEQQVQYEPTIPDDHVMVTWRPPTPREKARRVMKAFEWRMIIMTSKLSIVALTSILFTGYMSGTSAPVMASDSNPVIEKIQAVVQPEYPTTSYLDEDEPGFFKNTWDQVKGWGVVGVDKGKHGIDIAKDWALTKDNLIKELQAQREQTYALLISNKALAKQLDEQAQHSPRYEAALNCVDTFAQYLKSTQPVTQLVQQVTTDNK